MNSSHLKILVSLSLLSASTLASASCHIAYDRNDQLVYVGQSSPVDLSGNVARQVQAIWPGGHLITSATAKCREFDSRGTPELTASKFSRMDHQPALLDPNAKPAKTDATAKPKTAAVLTTTPAEKMDGTASPGGVLVTAPAVAGMSSGTAAAAMAARALARSAVRAPIPETPSAESRGFTRVVHTTADAPPQADTEKAKPTSSNLSPGKRRFGRRGR